MRNWLKTKATEMTIGDTLKYTGLITIVAYGPVLVAMYWSSIKSKCGEMIGIIKEKLGR